ncbi:MAG: L-serine ammonia-lyase, iron-sulfur-dependent subunit beta [Clostridiaceae bacterium]
MKEYSVFDIIGPIMIGPSSSHTAGAARLGKIASTIAGEDIKKVEFILHGSFSQTYKGHGTDRALVAGILGFKPCDERLRDSLELAKEKGIEIKFTPGDLGDVHPNTVRFLITLDNNVVVEVMGSSIGGGNILISEIDGEKVEFNNNYPTLLVKHRDIPGMLSKVSSLISDENINIAFLKVFRVGKGKSATMVFETDTPVNEKVISEIESLSDVESTRVIYTNEEGE